MLVATEGSNMSREDSLITKTWELLSRYINGRRIPAVVRELGSEHYIDVKDLYEVTVERFSEDESGKMICVSSTDEEPERFTTMVVIRPHPHTISTSAARYVLPPVDGFSPDLAYALTDTDIDRAESLERLPFPTTRFYRRQGSLGIAGRNCGVMAHDVLYGTLVDGALHDADDSSAASPVFCIADPGGHTPITHSINLFRWSSLKAFQKHAQKFTEVLKRHGDAVPLFRMQTQDGNKGQYYRVGVLAKLNAAEITDLMSRSLEPEDRTAEYLTSYISADFLGNEELPVISVAKLKAELAAQEATEAESEATPEPEPEEETVPEPEPEEKAATEPESDSELAEETEITEEPEPEPTEGLGLEATEEPELAEEPEPEPTPAPIPFPRPAPANVSVEWGIYKGISGYRCRPGYIKDTDCNFVVFDYLGGAGQRQSLPIPLLLDSRQAAAELMEGSYRLIEGRFCKARAELLGLADFCEELTFLPGCFTMSPGREPEPAFLISNGTKHATTHLLVRLELADPADEDRFVPSEFHRLTSEVTTLLPNGRPRLVSDSLLGPDAFALSLCAHDEEHPAVAFVVFDLELSSWFDTLHPDVYSFFSGLSGGGSLVPPIGAL